MPFVFSLGMNRIFIRDFIKSKRSPIVFIEKMCYNQYGINYLNEKQKERIDA